MFKPEIEKLLQQPLDRKFVRTRKGAGNYNLSYIEGWHAISEMNRIFGHGVWNRETVYCKEVCRYPVKIRRGNQQVDGHKVGYESQVRISVDGVVREGTGHGQGMSVDLYDAIEGAAKESETDAMKRAMITLGWPFGLALYDKDQINVSDTEITEADAERDVQRSLGAIDKATKTHKAHEWYQQSLKELEGMEVSQRNAWMINNEKALARLREKYHELYDDLLTKVAGE